jgi:ABC-2 type transport system permease protein
MAVYDRSYRRYEGEITPAWSRFLILPRYAYQEVFRSRLFAAYFALCFAVPFAGLLLIYLHHNLSALSLPNLPLDRLRDAFPIDAGFFYQGLRQQGREAFLLALFVGPALIAPDLRNNGLPLYLARPFSRAEYVLGKTAVLAILLSLMTWVPGLLLFLFQGYLEGAGWLGSHLRLAAAIFVGSWAWILLLSLLSLAISAWVRWKPLARVALMGIFFVLAGFAATLDRSLHTSWGLLLSCWHVIGAIWAALFGVETDNALPPTAAWAMWAAGCAACLWLLARRVRAYEVVK